MNRRTKEQRKKDRRTHKRARDEGRRTGPVLMTEAQARQAQLDRQHLLAFNRKEVERLSGVLPDEEVIVIADSRDPIARQWVLGFGRMTEEQLREREAAFILGNTIPTFFLAVPRDAAIGLTAVVSPHISAGIQTLPAGAGRVVVVIAAKGTLAVTFPFPWESASEPTGSS